MPLEVPRSREVCDLLLIANEEKRDLTGMEEARLYILTHDADRFPLTQ